MTSREAGRQGTVRTWFVIAPPGVVYLFTQAYSVKASRWRSDPWVRLTIPGTRESAQGAVRVVSEAEADSVAPLVVDRWGMWGATTPEGLKRLIRDREYLLLRVDPPAAPVSAEEG